MDSLENVILVEQSEHVRHLRRVRSDHFDQAEVLPLEHSRPVSADLRDVPDVLLRVDESLRVPVPRRIVVSLLVSRNWSRSSLVLAPDSERRNRRKSARSDHSSVSSDRDHLVVEAYQSHALFISQKTAPGANWQMTPGQFLR